MDLSSTLMFIEVAKAGSFTQAAKALAISKSHLSTKVSQLEKDLGVTLLARTTRTLRLTEAGEKYFRKCLPAINELRSAQEQASQTQTVPTGWIRMTAPFDFCESGLTDALGEYMRRYPEVRVDIFYSDRLVDLVAENFDLAIRTGRLNDSSLIAKKVGDSSFALVASPKYLKESPPIRQLKDLSSHACLLFSEAEDETWKLVHPTGTARVKVKARAKANNLLALKRLVLAHRGIALLPTFICDPELSQGKILSPLPGFQTARDPIHLVYPASRAHSPKLKALLPVLEKAVQAIAGN